MHPVLNPHRYEEYQQLLQTPEWQAATRLFPRTSDVLEYNTQALRITAQQFKQPLFHIRAQDTTEGKPITLELSPKEEGDNMGGLLTVLTITVGAEIMLRHNLHVADGLHNGARGRIARIDWPETNMHQIVRQGHLLEIETNLLPEVVFVHFHDARVGMSSPGEMIDNRRAIKITPRELTFEHANKRITRKQLPFIPSYAVTIHKCQSLTLPRAVIDIGTKVFGRGGMVYTALSRVRRLEDLLLLGFCPQRIKADEAVAAEYNRMAESLPPGPDNEWATDFILFDKNISNEKIN